MTLLIMAAGLGSRYGGLKQMDPVGPNGEFILDYTVYDAVRAGFDRVIFVIRPENEQAFRETLGDRIASRHGGRVEVRYAFQELSDLPEGFSVPPGREKQWGTAHAVLAARELLRGEGFAVVNADDLYGKETFRLLHNFLSGGTESACGCMVGFPLRNTMTENGTVSRGVCACDESGCLLDICEDGVWHPLDKDCIVSMNAWALDGGFLRSAEAGFSDFLRTLKDPLKQEYYLPTAVWAYRNQCGRPLRVLRTSDRWYGVTYREDRQRVVEHLREQTANGAYPS